MRLMEVPPQRIYRAMVRWISTPKMGYFALLPICDERPNKHESGNTVDTIEPTRDIRTRCRGPPLARRALKSIRSNGRILTWVRPFLFDNCFDSVRLVEYISTASR